MGRRAVEEGFCPTKSHLRHSARYSSVLGEPFDHAPLPLSKSLPLGRSASEEGLYHEVSPPTRRTVLECIGRTVRSCSTASFEEPATGMAREQGGVVSRGLTSDTALVLGETLRSCSTVIPGEPATGTACERGVISRGLTSNTAPGTRVSWATMLQENDFEIRSRTRMRDRERGREEGLG